jgi:hypothetical protein
MVDGVALIFHVAAATRGVQIQCAVFDFRHGGNQLSRPGQLLAKDDTLKLATFHQCRRIETELRDKQVGIGGDLSFAGAMAVDKAVRKLSLRIEANVV